jgi:hypothetical protein
MKPRKGGFALPVILVLSLGAVACAPDGPTELAEEALTPALANVDAPACVAVVGRLFGTGDPVPAIGEASGDLEGVWVGIAAPSPVGSGEVVTGKVAHLASFSSIVVTGGSIPALVGQELIFEGPHDIQVILEPERVHGRWNLVAGARNGSLTVHGTAQIIALPMTVEFDFGYRGVICP